MGWNLSRRYILIATAAVLPLFGGDLPVEAKRTVSFPNTSINEELPLPVKRNLRSEVILSFPFEMNSTIELFIEKYSSVEKLAYLQRALDRAAYFRRHISRAIEEKKLPAELLYLPLVESAYRIDAVSPSGATGLWQFMLNSIEPYDITVDQWRDDRRDFWRATEAALEKLKYNYNKTGNWDLALAAYNYGLNGIQRAIATSGVDNYWELAEKGLIPGETARYLPKFLAISMICSYGGRYGLDLPWEEYPQWKRLELDRSVDLQLLAEESGIDFQLLRLGNGELIYNVTPPADSGYALKIPASYADPVSKALEKSDEAFMEFYRYSIQTGDTLSEISQHYKVPLSLLYRYNSDLSPRSLRAGQTVIIPALTDVPIFRATEEKKEDFKGIYIVSEGDTLWSISGKFATTPEKLASRNRLPLNGVLSIGMKLSVPRME